MLMLALRTVESRLTRNLWALCAMGGLILFGFFLLPPLFSINAQMRDGFGQLYGHDFAGFWIAGRAVLEIGPDAPWDRAAFLATFDQHFHGQTPPTARFNYPPPMMLVLVPLASLPITVAFPLAMLSGAGVLAFVLWRILPDWRTPIIALGTPLLWQAMIYGQWSVWFAAVLALALLPLMRGQDPASGPMAMFTLKPTLALALPLALCGPPVRWRSMRNSALATALLILLSVAFFGIGSWRSFLDAVPSSQQFLLRDLNELMAHSITVSTLLQRWGVPADWAQIAQMVWSGAVLILIARIMRSNAREPLKAATIAAGTLLVAPYCMIYDLALLLPAVAFYMRDAGCHGFRTGDRVIFSLGAILPYFALEIQNATAIPVGLVTVLVVFARIALRALHSSAENQSGSERDEQKARSMVPAKRLFQHEH